MTLGANGMLYLAGQKNREELLRSEYTAWDEARGRVNRELPAGSGVLFTGDTKRLGFKPRMFSYGPVAEPVMWRVTREAWSAEEARKKVKQVGITHHLHNVISADYRGTNLFPGPEWDPRQIAVYRDYVRKYFKVVYASPRIDSANGGFYLFEISGEERSRPQPVIMLPETEGMWAKLRHHLSRGELGKALLEWDHAADEIKEIPFSQVWLAKVRFQIHDYEGCVRVLRPGIAMGLNTGDNVDLCGTALYRMGRFEEAVRMFSLALRITPDKPGLKSSLGGALGARGQGRLRNREFGKAFRDAEQAMFLCPDDARPRLLMAALLAREGRVEEARGYARKAMAIAPDSRDAAGFLCE